MVGSVVGRSTSLVLQRWVSHLDGAAATVLRFDERSTPQVVLDWLLDTFELAVEDNVLRIARIADGSTAVDTIDRVHVGARLVGDRLAMGFKRRTLSGRRS